MIDRRRFQFGAAVAVLAMLMPFSIARAETDTLTKIKERGSIQAGVKYDTPPFGFLDDKNEPVGFDLDIVRKIAEKLGVKVNFVKVTSTTRIPLLVSGNVDIVAASMTNTPEREKVIDFSSTYYTGGQSLMVARDSTVKELKDLDGKEVAVQQGTTLEKNIASAAPLAKIIAFKDYDSAWLALAQGRVDALTGSLNILQGFLKNSPNFKIVGEPFSVEPFGIGLRKGDAELRDAVNAALREMWKSGEYTALYRKWFNADPTHPIDERP